MLLLMKKLLGIVVLGLLWCNVSQATNKTIHLSCPSVIFINKKEEKFKEESSYKVGSNVGHSFLKFKDKKKTQWTTVTIFNQGNSIPASDSNIWKKIPPQKLLKEKFLDTGSGLYFQMEDENFSLAWLIERKGKQFNLLQIVEVKNSGINYTTTSDKDFNNYQGCEKIDKQKFNKLIKIGIE